MKKILSCLAFLFLMCFHVLAHGEDFEAPKVDAEKEYEAMRVFIESLSDDNIGPYLKKLGKNGKFTVYRFQKELTEKYLTDSEKQLVGACVEKFELHLNVDDAEKLYVYCFDTKKTKLLVEKTLNTASP